MLRQAGVSVCSAKVYLNGDDLWIHEIPLNSNKSVTFDAQDRDAVPVGVLFWFYGKKQYVWSKH